MALSTQDASERLTGVLIGGVLGVAVVGWPFSSGALLNLDLVAIGDLDVPTALLGDGSATPRRAPLQAVLAALSPPLSAASITRLWMVAIVATAFSGMAKLLRSRVDDRSGVSTPIALGGACLYALSPFLLTRLGVGHLGFATAAALLPWTFPVLVHPLRSPRRTFFVLGLIALCGYFGLIVAAPVVLIGLVLSRQRPSAVAVLGALISQVPWLVPALLGIGASVGAEGSAQFPTTINGVADVARLPLGYGFWRDSNQLGERGLWSVGFSLVVLFLAGAGLVWRPPRDRNALVVLAGLGAAIALASTIPGVRGVFNTLTEIVLFAPIREGQRLLIFVVFAVVILGCSGLQHLIAVRSDAAAVTAAIALAAGAAMTVAGSFNGLDGAATAHPVPEAWEQVVDIVETDPGPTLALPWDQYFDVAIAGGVRAHTPLPFLFDGDVIYRQNLALDGDRLADTGDARWAATLVRALRFGDKTERPIAELDLRWVVALPDIGRRDIEQLDADDNFVPVVNEPSISLFSTALSSRGVDPADADGESGWRWWVLVLDGIWLALWAASWAPGPFRAQPVGKSRW